MAQVVLLEGESQDDTKVEWEKIVGVTVLLLGIIHVVYFCKQDGRVF